MPTLALICPSWFSFYFYTHSHTCFLCPSTTDPSLTCAWSHSCNSAPHLVLILEPGPDVSPFSYKLSATHALYICKAKFKGYHPLLGLYWPSLFSSTAILAHTGLLFSFTHKLYTNTTFPFKTNFF